ncbi:MAG: hypothetical protein R3C32_08740 [Chloroflexota bacterium]
MLYPIAILWLCSRRPDGAGPHDRAAGTLVVSMARAQGVAAQGVAAPGDDVRPTGVRPTARRASGTRPSADRPTRRSPPG